MPAIHRCDLPADALLSRYQYDGAFADCYVATIARRVAHAEYVETFYTTTRFRTERLLLSWFASKPSTDAEAKQLCCWAFTSSIPGRCSPPPRPGWRDRLASAARRGIIQVARQAIPTVAIPGVRRTLSPLMTSNFLAAFIAQATAQSRD